MKPLLRPGLRAAPHRWVLAAVALLSNVSADAHEGHGLPAPSHWHATDALVAVAVVLAVILITKGRKK